MKKPIIAFATACALASSKALAACSSEETQEPSQDAVEPAAESSAPAAEEKYTIEGETMTSDGYSTKIAGTLTNNTDKEIGYLQLSYSAARATRR